MPPPAAPPEPEEDDDTLEEALEILGETDPGEDLLADRAPRFRGARAGFARFLVRLSDRIKR